MYRHLLLISLLTITNIYPSFAAEDEDRYSAYFQNISGEYSRSHILEFWGYHNSQGAGNYDDTLRLRYYQPLDFDNFRGTLRLDTAYVAAYGPSIPADTAHQYQAGNTMLTFWGNHPGLLPHWGVNVGGRIVFPFGNHGQWAIGPQIGSSYRPAKQGLIPLADFSPLFRYMYGFDSKKNSFQNNPNQPPLARNLQIYPTLGFQITPNTQIRMWDENGMVYNSAGGGWFVPIDAMVTHRLTKYLLLAVGASKQVVQTYNQYDWSLYGKVSLNF
jgi:hypothetical protein